MYAQPDDKPGTDLQAEENAMAEASRQERHAVYVVDGARTPFLKTKGAPGPLSASDLAVAAGRTLLLRQTFEPTDLDEVILGCMMCDLSQAQLQCFVSNRRPRFGVSDSVLSDHIGDRNI